MRVETSGQSSGPINVAVTDVALGIFTDQPLGKGSPVILNGGGSRNSQASPAAKGSNITFFVTGEGVTNPPALALAPIDGRLASAPLPAPVQSVVVGVNNGSVNVLFAGAAPGYAGMMQVNAQLDANTPSGAVGLAVAVGSTFSQTVNVYVQ
jgi:uncharacterized protein (TIGR03437 family)